MIIREKLGCNEVDPPLTMADEQRWQRKGSSIDVVVAVGAVALALAAVDEEEWVHQQRRRRRQ